MLKSHTLSAGWINKCHKRVYSQGSPWSRKSIRSYKVTWSSGCLPESWWFICGQDNRAWRLSAFFCLFWSSLFGSSRSFCFHDLRLYFHWVWWLVIFYVLKMNVRLIISTGWLKIRGSMPLMSNFFGIGLTTIQNRRNYTRCSWYLNRLGLMKYI